MKLSNHLADIHQLSAIERKYYLSGAKYLSGSEKPGDMSSRKRMRSDLEDDMSTVARDEESEEEMSSPKECEMNPTMKRQQFRTKIFSVHRTTTKVLKRLTTLVMKAKVPKRRTTLTRSRSLESINRRSNGGTSYKPQ